MSKKILTIIGSMLLGGSVIAHASSIQPEINLDLLKAQIIQYHESGAYQYDIAKVVDEAQDYLQKVIAENKKSKHPEKLAIILDIDETALSNYQDLKKLDFGGTPQMQNNAENKANDPAILPTLDLYKYAINNGVTVFFITGRTELSRKASIKNLVDVGYTTVKDSTENCESNAVTANCLLYLRDGKYLNGSAIPYKTAMRKKIEDSGYTIVENIGDQYSDLAGGYSQRTFKYPDNMYYIP